NIDLPNVFTPQRGGWSSFDQYPRQLADVNGDGRADIIGFGETNVFVSLAPFEVGIDGDDTLDGGAGADTMLGGIGNDTYIVDNAGDVVTELANQGTDTVFASIDYTLGENLENLTLTGTAVKGVGNGLNNVMTGNANDNFFEGGDGDDELIGLEGDDFLDGGLGVDVMVGGAGNDTYVYADGDFIVEAADEGIDTVISFSDYTLGNTLENLELRGTAVKGVGNGLNNVMTGNANDNFFEGGDGDDELIGLEGDDFLDGGLGVDVMVGGAGNDTYVYADGDFIVEAANEGIDTVISFSDYALTRDLENLTLAGSSTKATGNRLDNVLTGTDGANIMNGRKGDDILLGGVGEDTLKGEEGADRFVFTSPTEGGDRIKDFSSNQGDKLVFVASGFEDLLVPGLQPGQFVVGRAASDRDDRFIYTKRTGELFYDADGSGSGAKTLIATFEGQPSLSANDFVITDTVPF
ncbi:MAG: calcium-binding protein, partial [Synechococcales bacterium]|nr:calcium-binding protein [Synechococcales bacterium]